MRTSNWLRVAAFAGALAMGTAAMAGAPTFQSAEEALTHGLAAYKDGSVEGAIPAFEFAAERDEFLAQYYLARIYSDDRGAHTDHGKAYALYQKIADDYADADPDEEQHARLVGRSLTALAGYWRAGPPVAGLKPDISRASAYLRHAALFFRDEDAQFELAKMQLRDDGGEGEVRTAKHWLSVLSQKGHPGAQAFLADLYWRGDHMDRDPVRALVLATIAVTNAPAGERVWIEDIHQVIFCGSSSALRDEASALIGDWRHRYGRKPAVEHPLEPADVDLRPQRTCGDDEPVTYLEAAAPGGETQVKAAAGSFLEGSTGAGVHGVGTQLAPSGTE